MAENPENLIFAMLRRIEQKIDRLDLKQSDLTDSVYRIEAELGSIRGSVAALRHDVKIFADRWSDIEVRMRAVEANER